MGIKLRVGEARRFTNKMKFIGKESLEVAADTLEEKAEDIQDLAKRQAPVDTHNLENAIKIDGPNIGRDKVEIEVYVEGQKNDYDVIMHEGTYNLGKKSKAKQESDMSVRVGDKYLARAYEELQPSIKKAVQKDLNNLYRRFKRRSQ